MGLEVEGCGFAGSEEERDVFHLHERHYSLCLESKCVWDCEIDKPEVNNVSNWSRYQQ